MAKGSGSGPAILLEGVKFGWPGSDGFSLAVRHLDIGLGESVLLLGPSGSGKSTLLSLICGIVTPAAGNITVLGEDLAAMSAVARDRFRAEHYGIIFQMFNLLPYAGALDNVLLPLHFAPRRMRAVQRNGSAEQAASGLLKALGFDDIHASSRKTANLSIGQQQRVAAARALIGSPELIIADEPTSADRKSVV